MSECALCSVHLRITQKLYVRIRASIIMCTLYMLCFKYIFVAISIKIEKSKKNHALSHFDRLSWLEMLRHNTDFGLMRHILSILALIVTVC